MDTFFSVLEVIGVIAFALSGAMLAIRKEMDILGVCVMGATTAVGGGIMRDLLLGRTPPATLQSPTLALVSIGVSVLIFLPVFQKLLRGKSHKIYDTVMLVADSMGLGLFTVMGVNVCYEVFPEASVPVSVFLGVVTGCGGGVLRDMMSLSKPYILVKHFYACAAIIGALLCALLRPHLGEPVASLIGSVVIFALRIAAALFRWRLPKYSASFWDETKQP